MFVKIHISFIPRCPLGLLSALLRKSQLLVFVGTVLTDDLDVLLLDIFLIVVLVLQSHLVNKDLVLEVTVVAQALEQDLVVLVVSLELFV